MQPKPVLPPLGNMTLEQAIRLTAKSFERAELNYGHGTDNALDEASWLILFALGLPVDQAPNYSMLLSEQQLALSNELIHRRISERIPVAYLTGTAWFAGHEFYCDERALVPRSPLAEFINSEFFGLFHEHDSVIARPPERILDLCTGGGCIGISCALACPESTVVCSDISQDALALARSNVAQHQLEERVTLVESNLLENIEGKFDLIISNPPYVDANDIESMPKEFHAEPMLGLAAGNDGLDLVHTILQDSQKHLTERGWLVVEVGNSQPAMEREYSHLPLAWMEFAMGGGGIFQLPLTGLRACWR